MSTRPYFTTSGADLIALIGQGNKHALAEAKHRSSRKVQQAVRAHHAATAPKPQPKSVPAPKVIDPNTELRRQAWALRCEAKAAGEKLSYAEACELVGTTPARKVA